MSRISVQLPVLSGETGFKSLAPFSEPERRRCEPVGPGFLAHARRTLRGRTWSEDEKIEAQRNIKDVEDEEEEYESEPEEEEMLQHDPKDWKTQDQYAVLGLSKYRWRATEDQIRKAHRHKVLKHHPDKKAAEGSGDEDGFFKCIQKSFEALLDPTKRRQWDSVDKKADVAPPKNSTGDFFDRWDKVFEAEGRFSTKQPVPSLGTIDSPKEEVDAFYSFFYNFDSWRTFEWLDEDVPDDSSNRDHKRYIEKKNKAARQKHKKDDIARLQKLIDTAIAEDPRIKLFKEAEKKRKAQAKWEREAGSREAAEKAKKEKEEAEKKATEAAAAAKANKESAKKSKEAAKNAKKKNKRALRNSVKDVKYFGEEGNTAVVADITVDVDALVEALDDEALADAAAKIANADAATVSEVFTQGLKDKGLSAKYFK